MAPATLPAVLSGFSDSDSPSTTKGFIYTLKHDRKKIGLVTLLRVNI